ncbi:MAG: type I restriction-modification system subunit M N-terminal domain-containing protein [Methanothrix sp.]
MARGRRSNNTNSNGATLGFGATLWAAADKLRNKIDDAEYKHVLGLIFLKYIFDPFEESLGELQGRQAKRPYYIMRYLGRTHLHQANFYLLIMAGKKYRL